MSSRRALLESLLLSRLPSAFQEVEYIESSGTQYIDTGVSGGSTGGYEISFQPTSYLRNYQQYLAGDRLTTGNKVPKLFAYSSLLQFRIEGNTTYQLTLTSGVFNKIEVKENGDFYLNGTQEGTFTISNGFGDKTMCIFNANEENNLFSAMRLEYLKLNKDGTLVRYFIPCYRKADNEVGLYDLVNGVFYTNAGTGTFTKGGNV